MNLFTETEGWDWKLKNKDKGLINVLNLDSQSSSNGLCCTLKLINLVHAEVNILLLSGDKVRSGRFHCLCRGVVCSHNTKMRWPFMVAFSTAFNAFISTKPLTTYNQSYRELVMSIMADGSKKYFLIHLQLLFLSLLLGAMLNHTDLCINKSSCWTVHKVPKSKLELCLPLTLLCMMPIISFFDYTLCSGQN